MPAASGFGNTPDEIPSELISAARQELAVLTADLVAYSELMFKDMNAGIAILRRTRAILTDCIQRHDGRILQTPGDFILSTFDEFEHSLRAAANAQEELLKHHLSMPERRAGHWKIGIAQGDVYAIEDDFFGNAINVASRLQSLAAPGEIYFTGGPEHFDIPEGLLIQVMGQKALKNIDQPVLVHRGMLRAYDEFMQAARPKFVTPPKLMMRMSKPVLRLERFRKLDKSSKSRLFAEGLVEEIQLILSRLSNTISVTDPAAAVDARHDYVLSGAIQSRGNYARVIARLTSAVDGQTIWSERFECDLNRSFDLQDQISQEIVSTLQLHLVEGAQVQLWRRGTRSGKAWEFFQQAHDVERRFTRQGHQQAKQLYREAIQLDPNYLNAIVALAFCHLDELRLGWTESPTASLAAAEELLSSVSEFVGRDPDVTALQAFLYLFQHKRDEARSEIQKAAQLAPHSPEIIAYGAALLDLMGDYGGAIRAYNKALAMSAHAPAWISSNLGLSYLAAGDAYEAERIYREVLSHHPNYVRAHIGLTIALNRQGRQIEAIATGEAVLALDPKFSTQEWMSSKPFYDDGMSADFATDLRAAGIP
jgi:adenylate cyclase